MRVRQCLHYEVVEYRPSSKWSLTGTTTAVTSQHDGDTSLYGPDRHTIHAVPTASLALAGDRRTASKDELMIPHTLIHSVTLRL
jgi:hypothetical protein